MPPKVTTLCPLLVKYAHCIHMQPLVLDADLVFLQANLTISPTALLPSPMSPGAAKPQELCFSTNLPSSPASPTAAPKPGQEEAPASFEKPVEGSVLLSINKVKNLHSNRQNPKPVIFFFFF